MGKEEVKNVACDHSAVMLTPLAGQSECFHSDFFRCSFKVYICSFSIGQSAHMENKPEG